MTKSTEWIWIYKKFHYNAQFEKQKSLWCDKVFIKKQNQRLNSSYVCVFPPCRI
jgi:hypothetical protein